MVVVPFLAALALVAPSGELRSDLPIGALGAGGATVAFRYCGSVLTWSPQRHAHPIVRGGGQCLIAPSPTYPVAVAGRDVAWFAFAGGIHKFLTFFARPAGGRAYPVATDSGLSGRPTEPPTVGLLGADRSFVYTHWDLAQGVGDDVAQQTDPNRVAASVVYRLQAGSPPVPIARADGNYETFAFDGAHVAVRRHLDGLDVLDLGGNVLAAFDSGTRVLGAELDWPRVDIAVAGRLLVYDVPTRALVATPRFPSNTFDVTCLRVYCPYSLALAGAAHGLVAYLYDHDVWLLDVARDVTCAVHPAIAARLTSAGLFYSFQAPAADPWPGRLRFVPLSELRC